ASYRLARIVDGSETVLAGAWIGIAWLNADITAEVETLPNGDVELRLSSTGGATVITATDSSAERILGAGSVGVATFNTNSSATPWFDDLAVYGTAAGDPDDEEPPLLTELSVTPAGDGNSAELTVDTNEGNGYIFLV